MKGAPHTHFGPPRDWRFQITYTKVSDLNKLVSAVVWFMVYEPLSLEKTR